MQLKRQADKSQRPKVTKHQRDQVVYQCGNTSVIDIRTKEMRRIPSKYLDDFDGLDQAEEDMQRHITQSLHGIDQLMNQLTVQEGELLSPHLYSLEKGSVQNATIDKLTSKAQTRATLSGESGLTMNMQLANC